MLPMELPPRARRILRNGLLGPAPSGTTSACAENTATILEPTRPTRNYLRVRGEYLCLGSVWETHWELPPRARRIRLLLQTTTLRHGTTSACAENTTLLPCGAVYIGNYLRVRGEYQPQQPPDQYRKELPPRARRIHPSIAPATTRGGTTSACAENTDVGRCVTAPPRELPPRARRILTLNINESNKIGTTSACAENTRPCGGCHGCGWNYLRVRGEYAGIKPIYGCELELPPRARRIPLMAFEVALSLGTTSACAENTFITHKYGDHILNYLRVRGEYPK